MKKGKPYYVITQYCEDIEGKKWASVHLNDAEGNCLHNQYFEDERESLQEPFELADIVHRNLVAFLQLLKEGVSE